MPYFAPETTTEALTFLRASQARIVAGCTDYYPGLATGQIDENVLDITRLAGCRGVSESSNGWRIGAATTWTQIVKTELPPAFDALKIAARQVGSIQIQNRGTIAGNICNASPAADGVPPLLVLDAAVEILSHDGVRTVPLKDFITGVRKVDLAEGEFVSAILVPPVSRRAKSAFLKLGSRSHMVISIAMVASIVEIDAGRIVTARLAVGSCSPVAQRLTALENQLAGLSADEVRLTDFAADGALAPLTPISDVRGSQEYRIDVAAELCRRAVLCAFGED